MKLLIQNTCANEFLPGCEYTVVDVDAALMATVAARTRAFMRALADDRSLWQARWWDSRPVCFSAFDGLDGLARGCPFDQWIEDGGGWVLVGDLAVPDREIVATDCQAMTLTAAVAIVEVGWVYQVKETPEVIRTAGVDLRLLGGMLGDGTLGEILNGAGDAKA